MLQQQSLVCFYRGNVTAEHRARVTVKPVGLLHHLCIYAKQRSRLSSSTATAASTAAASAAAVVALKCQPEPQLAPRFSYRTHMSRPGGILCQSWRAAACRAPGEVVHRPGSAGSLSEQGQEYAPYTAAGLPSLVSPG